MRTRIALLLALLLLVAACGDEETPLAAAVGGSTTIVDEDGDGFIDDAPEGVNDIFSAEDLQALVDAGLDLHLGDEPPSFAGSFLADSLAIRYDDLGLEGYLAAYVYAFSGQTDEGEITVAYESVDIDESDDTAAFIAGTEDCFSIFAVFSGYTPDDDCNYERATVLSGCLDEGNIADFMLGFIMTSLMGECAETLPVGHMRIVAEADGYAYAL